MTKNGLIAIDKPEGISSAAVVARIKRKLGVKKVGHTGTLDPFATGLMLCGINKGTKLSRFFLGGSKHYIAEVALGIETDTQDYTGQIIDRCNPLLLNTITNEKIIETVVKFKGIQMQKPPVYSALKHNGKPLYQLAREGRPIQKPPRSIEIHSISVHSIRTISKPEFLESDPGYLENILTSEPTGLSTTQCLSKLKCSEYLAITISIHCSSGTYIRSLAHDIGQRLGCGGCLSSLRRTETCGFSIDDAISLSQFEDISKEEAANRIINMAQTIPFMPVIQADDEMMETIRFGRIFRRQLSVLNTLADFSDTHTEPMPLESSNTNYYLPSSDSYLKVIDSTGELAAIVQYDQVLDKYDYCCVFVN